MSRSWLDAKDSEGNTWPDWNVEEYRNKRDIEALIESFNAFFKRSAPLPWLRFDEIIPLPSNTIVYMTHNEIVHAKFDKRNEYFVRRRSCEACHVSLGIMTEMRLPVLTWNDASRQLHCVLPDIADKTRYAIYRMDNPLWRIANYFDNYDDQVSMMRKAMENWDPLTPIHSKCPSHGHGRGTPGGFCGFGGGGGWGQTRRTRKDNDRPTPKEIYKSLKDDK